MNEPLTQLQLWKALRNGDVLRLGPCELRAEHSDMGEYVVSHDGIEHHCTALGDAAIALVTILGKIERGEHAGA